MDMNKKLMITDKDIEKIKDFAHLAFKNRPTFGSMSASEIQAFCIVDGLASFLGSKGMEIPFELQGFVQEDCEPVDDGMGDMPEEKTKRG
jgi:hypothetical protein